MGGPGSREPNGPGALAPQEYVLLPGNDTSPQRFASLEAALNAAVDDDIIELDFDGRARELLRPIRITRRVTLRAAARRRPLLEVGITRIEAASGAIPTPRMFQIAGGALQLADLDLC